MGEGPSISGILGGDKRDGLLGNQYRSPHNAWHIVCASMKDASSSPPLKMLSNFSLRSQWGTYCTVRVRVCVSVGTRYPSTVPSPYEYSYGV